MSKLESPHPLTVVFFFFFYITARRILQGHLKKLGCADQLVPWGDDPSHKAPTDPGHHALQLYTLSLYPPRREYWWELPGCLCFSPLLLAIMRVLAKVHGRCSCLV
jgi:hypothetical protein